MAEGFLDGLSQEETEALEAAGRRRAYGRNVTLFHEGDEVGPVVVLLRGRVKLAILGEGGREAIVAVRGPGDLLGELAAIDDGPRSTTVTTLEPVEVLLLSRSDFPALLEERPRIALVILRLVAGRLRYADRQQAQFATHDLVGRLARRLVELSDRFGTRGEDSIEIDLPMSQEELGSWIGASREG
jgi:CRP/FNR family transcriptional regulator, cyclic AMP receptor protein